MRNNSNCWINFNQDNVLLEICSRISKLINISLDNSESLQIFNYKPGERYKPHYDSFKLEDLDSNKSQRIITHLFKLCKRGW